MFIENFFNHTKDLHMNKIISKAIKMLGMALFAFLFLTNPLFADNSEDKTPLSEYLKEYPSLGLITDKISFGPITVSKVSIHKGNKLAYVSPGTILRGKLDYEIDSKDLKSLHLYHLTVGIKNEGAQDCASHNLGVWNPKGHGIFSLRAPEKPGIYEVCFVFAEGSTCARAYEAWNPNKEIASSSATIGYLIVQ
jgi:hypothetical protein